MHLGISTYSFPWNIGVPGFLPEIRMTAYDLLRFAADRQISHVQFGDNLPLHTMLHELDSIHAYAVSKGLSIEVGMKRLEIAQAVEYIKVARKLLSPFVRVVIDDGTYRPSKEEVIGVLRDLLPILRENKIMLAIENHDRFPSRVLVEIIENSDPGLVGICLDTANSYGAMEGTYETVSILAPFTINLHIKDVAIERVDHKMGFKISGTAAGKGMLDIPRIIGQVRDAGKCRSVTLEVWSDFIHNITTTTQNELAAVDASLSYLKTIKL